MLLYLLLSLFLCNPHYIPWFQLRSTLHNATSTMVDIVYVNSIAVQNCIPKLWRWSIFHASTLTVVYIPWFQLTSTFYVLTLIVIDIAYVDFHYNWHRTPQLQLQSTLHTRTSIEIEMHTRTSTEVEMHTRTSTVIDFAYTNFDCGQNFIPDFDRVWHCKLQLQMRSTLHTTISTTIDFDHSRHCIHELQPQSKIAYLNFDYGRHFIHRLWP